MRAFDFATKFEHATFVFAGHGDGEGAELVFGWRELVRKWTRETIDDDPSEAELARGERDLTENEDWAWSSAKESQPFYLSVAFEAESVSIYRLESAWRPISTAPRDGTMLDLLVPESDDRENSLVDGGDSVTIGFNNFDNDGEDTWLFAGWCWSHDHFTEGHGKPTHWRPRSV